MPTKESTVWSKEPCGDVLWCSEAAYNWFFSLTIKHQNLYFQVSFNLEYINIQLTEWIDKLVVSKMGNRKWWEWGGLAPSELSLCYNMQIRSVVLLPFDFLSNSYLTQALWHALTPLAKPWCICSTGAAVEAEQSKGNELFTCHKPFFIGLF